MALVLAILAMAAGGPAAIRSPIKGGPLLQPVGQAEPTKSDLVDVTALIPGVVIEMPYATPDNFMGKAVYPRQIALLRRGTAEKLAQAQRILQGKDCGLKVWDAYRPLSVQWTMWRTLPDPAYVADPRAGSRHNRGAAVDCTLVDGRGRECGCRPRLTRSGRGPTEARRWTPKPVATSISSRGRCGKPVSSPTPKSGGITTTLSGPSTKSSMSPFLSRRRSLRRAKGFRPRSRSLTASHER